MPSELHGLLSGTASIAFAENTKPSYGEGDGDFLKEGYNITFPWKWEGAVEQLCFTSVIKTQLFLL